MTLAFADSRICETLFYQLRAITVVRWRMNDTRSVIAVRGLRRPIDLYWMSQISYDSCIYVKDLEILWITLKYIYNGWLKNRLLCHNYSQRWNTRAIIIFYLIALELLISHAHSFYFNIPFEAWNLKKEMACNTCYITIAIFWPMICW